MLRGIGPRNKGHCLSLSELGKLKWQVEQPTTHRRPTDGKLLLFVGFKKIGQKGSHAFYRHPDGRVTTVPFHIGRDLARPLIREILREIEGTVDDYNAFLKKL